MNLELDGDVLVSTEWLAGHLDDPGVRIVDCRNPSDGRTGRDEYERGHLPGAVLLDWSTELRESERPMAYKVASADKVKRVMESLGVGDDTLLVGYDDEAGHFASRVWLVLAAHGHGDQVRILDGGIVKWEAEGRPLTTDAPITNPVTFTPRPDRSLLVTADQVNQALGEPNTVILDVRRASEFTGEEVRAKRGGRIPGAIHAFWQDTVNWDGNRDFMPVHAIRARYEQAGLDPGQRVITYCQSAVRAAHSALALRMAGFTNVQVYDGSWEEWAERDDLPIETGPAVIHR